MNPQVDLAYYGKTELSGPEPRPFRLPRPDNVYRIVICGGSTVIGFPYPAEVAFPRHVEVLLEAQNPDVDVEVLNCGVTSINSFSVADLVDQCLAVQPDLVVVHTGHNEFYGPGGAASKALNLSPSLIRTTFRLRRWRSVQALSSSMSPAGDMNEDLLDVLPANLSIPFDSPVVKQAEQNLESNLMLLKQRCQKAGVELLLTTVACNLRDQSPMKTVWPEELSGRDKDRCSVLLREAEILTEAGEDELALVKLKESSQICEEYALTQFRLGQCHESLGDTAEAFRCYRLAADLDGCRFRSPSHFGSVVKGVAGQEPHCQFLDTENAVNRASAFAAPGFDFFLEHVHYNQEGHAALADILAKYIQTECRGLVWDESLIPNHAERRALLGWIPEDDLLAYSLAIQVLQTGPFAETTDKDDHQIFLQSRIAETWADLSEDRANAFADAPMSLMSGDLPRALSEQHATGGDSRLVDLLKDIQIQRRPWEQCAE